MTKPNLVLQRLSRQHGIPPLSFTATLVAWAAVEDLAVFAPNDNPSDIFASVKPYLATPLGKEGEFVWDNIEHRRMAMAEVALVHAGFESDWNWKEGVDVTNRTSLTHKEGEEAGAFEMSFDMEYLRNDAMRPWALAHALDTPEDFITRVKADPFLDLQTYARLLRVNIAWAGPIIRHEIHPFLRQDRMRELGSLIAEGWRPATEDIQHKTIGS